MSRYSDVQLDRDPYATKLATISGKTDMRRIQNTSSLGTKELTTIVSARHSSSQHMLPTLGLQKYSNVDLSVSFVNPYKLHKQTEKLLVMRERERDQILFNKRRQDKKTIFEKGTLNDRPDRTGVIRTIKNIEESNDDQKNRRLNGASLDFREAKQKFNVFDSNDSTLIKKERLNSMAVKELEMSLRKTATDVRSLSSLEPVS